MQASYAGNVDKTVLFWSTENYFLTCKYFKNKCLLHSCEKGFFQCEPAVFSICSCYPPPRAPVPRTLLCNLFKQSATCRVEACWAGTDCRTGTARVICNHDRKPTWSAELGRGAGNGELRLIAGICLRAQLEAFPQLPIRGEGDGVAVGPSKVPLVICFYWRKPVTFLRAACRSCSLALSQL